jgi:hypothetical protein
LLAPRKRLHRGNGTGIVQIPSQRLLSIRNYLSSSSTPHRVWLQRNSSSDCLRRTVFAKGWGTWKTYIKEQVAVKVLISQIKFTI